MTDFILDNTEIKTLPAETFEGNEQSIQIRFEPSSLADSKAVLYINSNEEENINVYYKVSALLLNLKVHSRLLELNHPL